MAAGTTVVTLTAEEAGLLLEDFVECRLTSVCEEIQGEGENREERPWLLQRDALQMGTARLHRLIGVIDELWTIAEGEGAPPIAATLEMTREELTAALLSIQWAAADELCCEGSNNGLSAKADHARREIALVDRLLRDLGVDVEAVA